MKPDTPHPDRATEVPSTMSSEALLAAIVDSSGDAIVSKRLDGTIMSWNKAAERLFGYTAAEVVGRSIRILIPDELQHEEDAILARIGQGEPTRNMRTERLAKDGSLIRVDVTVSPVFDADGNIVGASKIARDVGSIIDAQAAADETQRRFHIMADNIAQLAWIADPDGWIGWYNARWFDYTGTTLGEMLGWGWKAVHHPDHVVRVESHFRASIEGGVPWEDTFPLRGVDGKYRWFLSRALPIRDADGNITSWFGTNTDITEQRAQADSIKALLREVNHRSKNLLTVIQAIAMRSAPGHEDFIKRFVRRIQALSTNQDILIQGEWSDIDLDKLIDGQLSFARDVAADGITAQGPEVKLSARAGEVLGMTLHELATNALKYGALSTPDGRVDIAWSLEHGRFSMEWRESGGPAVTVPNHDGFGTRVIRDIPCSALDADVLLEFPATGLVWKFSCAETALG